MKIPRLPCWLVLAWVPLQLGCGGGSDAWIPLTEGATWEHEMTVVGQYGEANTGIVRSTNMARRVLGDVSTTPQRIEYLFGGSAAQTEFSFTAESDEGVYTLARQSADDPEPKIESPPRYELKYPVEVGTAWEVAGQSSLLTHSGEHFSMRIAYQIETIDQVETVPAGTFENCVKVTAQGTGSANMGIMALNSDATVTVETQAWYCRGVGLTRMIHSERSNHLLVGSAKLSLLLRSYMPG